MDREVVRSGNIISIGYAPEMTTMEVELYSGDIYKYYNIPQKAHEAVMNTASKGSYFNSYIKEQYQ